MAKWQYKVATAGCPGCLDLTLSTRPPWQLNQRHLVDLAVSVCFKLLLLLLLHTDKHSNYRLTAKRAHTQPESDQLDMLIDVWGA